MKVIKCPILLEFSNMKTRKSNALINSRYCCILDILNDQ